MLKPEITFKCILAPNDLWALKHIWRRSLNSHYVHEKWWHEGKPISVFLAVLFKTHLKRSHLWRLIHVQHSCTNISSRFHSEGIWQILCPFPITYYRCGSVGLSSCCVYILFCYVSDDNVRKYCEHQKKKRAEPPVQVPEVDSCVPRTPERSGITLEDDPEGQYVTQLLSFF